MVKIIVNHSTDIEIRKALHATELQQFHQCKNTVVVDELGLIHGKNRIDIAVLNGCLHGYEIKSSKDTLIRLADQLRMYRECLEKLTLVVASNHLEGVLSVCPHWCGIVLADKGSRDEINFTTIRDSQKNPEIDAVSLAHLLWRKEAINILERLDVKYSKNITRIELYKKLSELVSISELTALIKEQFMARETWRVALQP
jgi:hypothetical protein